ncbi:MAG TPA: DUF1156 domain-containing protein, partial [Candidatus Cloacimonadota bacterium]|nr:DUF1156 domain-containing protein [Candidatus Cloacimonadota bacterium]
ICDAANHPLSDDSVSCFFTDPPYYDAIPYSDLSDFFLVWQKRIVGKGKWTLDPYDSNNNLSNKDHEIVQDDTRFLDGVIKDKFFFESQMKKVFQEGSRILEDNGIASVVFAHKTTEGWEALLSGIIEGGFTITSSWPISTERTARLRARESAALATSIHLVCRPRPENAGIGDWSHVLQELPQKVGKWIDRLEAEGVRGAD